MFGEYFGIVCLKVTLNSVTILFSERYCRPRERDVDYPQKGHVFIPRSFAERHPRDPPTSDLTRLSAHDRAVANWNMARDFDMAKNSRGIGESVCQEFKSQFSYSIPIRDAFAN